MRAAPRYSGEGPYALWHVSEDPAIRRFEPREGKVWAIATRLLPLELVELGDLVRRHEASGIELRTERDLASFWSDVISSTLGFSGIRLRNARIAT